LQKAKRLLDHTLKESWHLAKLASEVHLSQAKVGRFGLRPSILGMTLKANNVLQRRFVEAEIMAIIQKQ